MPLCPRSSVAVAREDRRTDGVNGHLRGAWPFRGITQAPILLEQETIRLLETCQKEYKDIRLEGKQLGEMATPMLYQIRFLSQGKKAPEITAADADGKEFKLSDYRG